MLAESTGLVTKRNLQHVRNNFFSFNRTTEGEVKRLKEGRFIRGTGDYFRYLSRDTFSLCIRVLKECHATLSFIMEQKAVYIQQSEVLHHLYRYLKNAEQRDTSRQTLCEKNRVISISCIFYVYALYFILKSHLWF